MRINNFLLPKGLKPLGIIFSLVAMLLLVLKYQFNYKPDFLNLRVFAIYSFYIEAKVFTVIKHQMIEEIAGVLLLAGLFILAFAREKNESEALGVLRLKAFFVTAYLNFFYLLVSTLFFFGFGFVGALTLFVVFWLVAYLVTFRYLLFRHNKEDHSRLV